MRITSRFAGNYPEPFNEDTTCVLANDFIPIYAIQSHLRVGPIDYYSKPSFSNILRKPNTLKNIKDALELGATTRRIEINHAIYYIAKGLIFSQTKELLFACTIKKEVYNNIERAFFEDESGPFSYSNYVIFYSSSFFTDPSLASFNRRLQKEILTSCYQKGIEVRVLSSSEIEKNTFARLFEVQKTKSLTQLDYYMEQVLPTFLYQQKEDTFVEQETELRQFIVELPIQEEALLFEGDQEEPVAAAFDHPGLNPSEFRFIQPFPGYEDDFPRHNGQHYLPRTYEDGIDLDLDLDVFLDQLEREGLAHTIPPHAVPPERQILAYAGPVGMEMLENAFRASLETPTPPPVTPFLSIELIDDTE